MHRKTRASLAGLVVIQALLSRLHIKGRLRACMGHIPGGAIFGHHVVILLLLVPLWLGYCELRDLRYYRDDSLVLRPRRLPDVATAGRDGCRGHPCRDVDLAESRR